MKKTELMNKVSRGFHKVGFKIKKHSPEILVIGGVAGVITSTVMACKATTKLDDILAEAKEKTDLMHEYMEKGEILGREYTEEDGKKDISITYVQTGVKIAKLYAPAVALGALSLTAIISSHHILKKRNVALAAAYTAVDKSFKDYRGRVIERFGKELDRELKFNIKNKEIEETVVNEDGTESTVKKTVGVMDSSAQYSPFSIVYDDGNNGWDPDPELSKFFLLQQQNRANDILKSRGHIFLNEIYDMLGAQRTTAGQVVGWIYDETDPTRDNYVDFGLFDIHREKTRDFINGYEKVVVLDFNVDGEIYEDIM